MLGLYTAIKLFALSSYLVLTLLTLRSKAAPAVRILFSIYIFGMSLWQLSSLMVNFSRGEQAALFWYNFLMASSGMYSILFFPFTQALLGITKKKVLAFCAYIACAFVFVVGILGLQWKGVILGRGGYWIPEINSRWLYVVIAVSYFFWSYGVFNLVRGVVKETSPVQRNRLVYVLIGAIIVMIGVPTNFTALRDYPVDIFLNLVSALVIGYAVVRHRLLDIRFILMRSIFYSGLTAALVAAYLGVVFGLESLLKRSIGYSGPAPGIIAILFIALIFLPIRNLLQKVLDRLFFREKSDYQNATQLFSREITSLYDTSEILGLVGATVAKAIKASNISITLLDEGKKVFVVRKSMGVALVPTADMIVGEQHELAQWLRANGRPLVREEALMDSRTRAIVEKSSSLFEAANVSLVVPILLKDKLTGTLNLGPKLSGTMYNDEDIRFLTTIANQTATAIEKSVIFQEVQRRLSEQTLLFILSEKFRSSSDFDSVMTSIVQILKNFLGCDTCALAYFEREGSEKVYALDPGSLTAAGLAGELRKGMLADADVRREAYPLARERIDAIVQRNAALSEREKTLLSSLVFFPLWNGNDLLGLLILTNRSGGESIDPRELELLRTIRAIVTQGIVLYCTIVDLVGVKTYNENILGSLNDMGDTLIILDMKGSIRSVNRATCELLGYREEDLTGHPMRLIAGDSEPLFTAAGFQDLIAQGSISNYEVIYRTRGGASIPMLFSGSVMVGEDGKTREIVGIARDITERLKAEEVSKNLVLIKEIHHRIKNNLQVISSLLYLQSGYVQDPQTREMFRESQNRVRSMALLHEKLYQSPNPAGIDFSEYIGDLTQSLFMSYGVKSSAIALTIEISGITLGMDTAVPCGLIINELVSNSLKHAFKDGASGEVHIVMVRAKPPSNGSERGNGQKWYTLTVSDNGKGFPEGLDFRTFDSLGLKLVCALTEQLSGAIDMDRTVGTKFTIKFKEL